MAVTLLYQSACYSVQMPRRIKITQLTRRCPTILCLWRTFSHKLKWYQKLPTFSSVCKIPSQLPIRLSHIRRVSVLFVKYFHGDLKNVYDLFLHCISSAWPLPPTWCSSGWPLPVLVLLPQLTLTCYLWRNLYVSGLSLVYVLHRHWEQCIQAQSRSGLSVSLPTSALARVGLQIEYDCKNTLKYFKEEEEQKGRGVGDCQKTWIKRHECVCNNIFLRICILHGFPTRTTGHV